MDTSQHTESIRDLISSIDREIVVLPEFQRDFVWDVGKSYDLFDSLTKDIFIGSIIYGVPSFEITARELDTRPRKSNTIRRKSLKLTSYTKHDVENKIKTTGFRLVLDGQQRITSIYRALKGADEIWLTVKRDEEMTEDIEFTKLSLEEILFEYSGQESSDRLSIKLSDVYNIMEGNFLESDEIREKFFQNLLFIQGKSEEEKRGIFRRFLSISGKIQDSFKAEKLLSYYLLDTTSEKFTIFFERSNSRGIQLKFIDILAAKLYAGFNLRNHIDDFESKYPDHPLNREIIVRAISYIVSEGRDIDKTFILTKLTHEHFDSYWQDLCNQYKKVFDFLYENHLIISQSWMPYENMLIPLIIFLRELKGDFCQMNEKQLEFIRYWYWASVFSQRYTGSSNEIIIQDSHILETIARGKKITDKSFFFKLKSQVESYVELYSFSKKASAIYRGILNLVNYESKGLLDWKNTRKLSFNSRLEDHHIFPKDYLHKQYKDDESVSELVDSVINRTLIPKITNIKIGKSTPSKYLQQLKSENPDLERCLSSHLIPDRLMSGFYDKDYLNFLEERAKAIFSLIQAHVINARDRIEQEFYQEPLLKGGNLKVFATYYNESFEASFNIKTGEIVFDGQRYTSVSSAASAVKKKVTGKDRSVNGWEFWKYLDEQNQERTIDTVRDYIGEEDPQLKFYFET